MPYEGRGRGGGGEGGGVLWGRECTHGGEGREGCIYGEGTVGERREGVYLCGREGGVYPWREGEGGVYPMRGGGGEGRPMGEGYCGGGREGVSMGEGREGVSMGGREGCLIQHISALCRKVSLCVCHMFKILL